MPATIVNTSINVLSGDVTKTAEIIKPIGTTVCQWIASHGPATMRQPPELTCRLVIGGGLKRDVIQKSDWSTAVGALNKWSYTLPADAEKIELTFTWPTGGAEADHEITLMAKFM